MMKLRIQFLKYGRGDSPNRPRATGPSTLLRTGTSSNRKNRFHHRSEKGQAMVEFLFIFILFTAIIFFVLQLTVIANAKSLLNLATYSAAREYITSHSTGMAQTAAATYMNPFLPGVGNGEVLWVRVTTEPSGVPSFGRQVTVTGTAYYKLQMPIVRRFFGVDGYLGYIPLKSTCTMTMETDGDN